MTAYDLYMLGMWQGERGYDTFMGLVNALGGLDEFFRMHDLAVADKFGADGDWPAWIY